METWPKVMEFCYQSWNFTIFVPELYQICMFCATTKKVSIVCRMSTFSEVFQCDVANAKSIREMVMEKSCMDKYFVKSVGSLNHV